MGMTAYFSFKRYPLSYNSPVPLTPPSLIIISCFVSCFSCRFFIYLICYTLHLLRHLVSVI